MPWMNYMGTAKERASIWDAREVTVYFALAYGISLVLWLPVLMRWSTSPFAFSAATFGPSLAALITHRIFARSWKAVRLWNTVADLVVGIVSGTLIILIAACTAAFFMTKSGMDRWQWSSLTQIVTLFGPNLLGGPLGEEAGWRGYALPRLQRRFDPVTSSLIVGFLWANWHLPLIIARVYNVNWGQFVALTMAASIFLSVAFNVSRGSTLCAIFVHGIYNVGTGVILNDLIGKAQLYSNPVQHNVLWLAYGSVAAVLCAITKGRLCFARLGFHSAHEVKTG
ncbi:MAG: CPBP family intramembrane metalloprotease [Acidobacteriaceae bacterium]|nr:CPBP family intramembrane metalloprotease [Acidobacteriaceae bacterium]